MRVLIIEDDDETAEYLAKGLSESGHLADRAATGTDGLAMALSGTYDVMVVDRMLPGMDGLSLVRVLREEAVSTPVLILSALGQVTDRVRGLKAGEMTTWSNHSPSPNSLPGWKRSTGGRSWRPRR